MTAQSFLIRQVKSIERLLEYELGRFTKISVGIIPPIILVFLSTVLSLLFTSSNPYNLENALLSLVLLTASGFSPPTIIGGPSLYYFVSPYLLDIIAPLPYAVKGAIAVLLTLRKPLYSYMSMDTYLIPTIVAALAASVMIFSSLVKEEDLFILIREDRNKIQVFRGVLYAFIYSLLGALTVFIIRTYLLSRTPLLSFLQPVFYTFSPILPLIPAFFIFLLTIQGVASFFNHFSSRLVYIIPLFLLVELFFFQLPITMTSLVSTHISDLMFFPEVASFFYDNPQYFFMIILMQISGQGYYSALTYLPLSNMSQLIQTFVFESSHGVWNSFFFDPNSFFYNSSIIFSDNILFNPAFSNALPPILILTLVQDAFTKPMYSATGSLLYFLVAIVLIYTINAIIFKRKTL